MYFISINNDNTTLIKIKLQRRIIHFGCSKFINLQTSLFYRNLRQKLDAILFFYE